MTYIILCRKNLGTRRYCNIISKNNISYAMK